MTEYVEIIHKTTGQVKTVTKSALGALHIRDFYDVLTSDKDDGDAKPDSSWRKADIVKYLKAKKIAFKAAESKADLLAKC
jgi:hypothetical protein